MPSSLRERSTSTSIAVSENSAPLLFNAAFHQKFNLMSKKRKNKENMNQLVVLKTFKSPKKSFYRKNAKILDTEKLKY